MIIEAKGLIKGFGKKKVIDRVKVQIKEGEILGLLGKNGVGKTVLMNILTGLILPNKGKVKFQNINIENNLHEYWEKINWASAYQSLQLHASTKENMDTFAGIYGVGKNEINEVLELVEMSESKLKNRKLFLLSSGEIGRVNLAKALLNKPKILFLDEPTAFLDPVFKEKFIKILKKINKEWGMTILFSSHQLDEVVSLCDRVMILKNKRLSYVGKVLDNKKLMSFF